jgi:hypothetical protein
MEWDSMVRQTMAIYGKGLFLDTEIYIVSICEVHDFVIEFGDYNRISIRFFFKSQEYPKSH